MNPPSNITEYQIGGRFMPRSTIETNTAGLLEALRAITQHGAVISGVSLNVSRRTAPNNAVNAAWRDTGIVFVMGTYV